jgi:hypothetical protein
MTALNNDTKNEDNNNSFDDAVGIISICPIFSKFSIFIVDCG